MSVKMGAAASTGEEDSRTGDKGSDEEASRGDNGRGGDDEGGGKSVSGKLYSIPSNERSMAGSSPQKPDV
jgi:hypothetical protein